MLIQAGVRARVPGRRAGLPGPDRGRPVRRLGRAVLGAGRRRAGLRRELLRARLAGRAPVVRALRRARVHGGDRAAAVRGRGRDRDRQRRRRWSRWAWRRRRSSRSSSCRCAFSRRPQGDRAQDRPTRRRSASPAAGASPSPCCASWSPSRRCSTRGVLAADLDGHDAAVAGYVFNALLIARAPLQLFQADPGLAAPPPRRASRRRRAGRSSSARSGSRSSPSRASRAPSPLGLLLLGPFAMSILFDDDATYGRLGLAAVALGMGAHLAAGTLNQAALARDHARRGRRRVARQRRACSWSGCCSTSSTTS